MRSGKYGGNEYVEKSEWKWQHLKTCAGEAHLTLQLLIGNAVDLTMNVERLF